VHDASIVVATCHATADDIARVTGFPRANIVVAPLGPREPPDEQRAPARPRWPYLLTIGAITPRKGLDVLAAAVARLGPSAPPVLAAGPDGLFSDDARRAVAARDTYGRFSFLGEVDDDRLASLLANATIVCHPSRAEGFGMVCLEAMSYGRAVVATDLPSVRELGADGVLLTSVDDPDEMAAAIERLLRDDDARMALGARARICAAPYTWDAFADAIVGAYDRALSRHSSS
jgi:glycosyltransferase involved in cell wall biosynthesis